MSDEYYEKLELEELDSFNKIIETHYGINLNEALIIRTSQGGPDGHYLITKRLIELGADVTDKAIACAIKSGRVVIFKQFIETGITVTDQMFNFAIGCMCRDGDEDHTYRYFDLVNLMIENDVDIDSNDNEAFKTACYHNNYKLVRRLIKAGCEIIITDKTQQIFNMAINICDTEIILKFIEAGVKITDKDIERIYDETSKEIVKKTQMKHVKSAKNE